MFIDCLEQGPLNRDSDFNLSGLSLGNNNIDNECAVILADALKGSTTLTHLNLRGNDKITTMGWEAFINVLCQEWDSSLLPHAMKWFVATTCAANDGVEELAATYSFVKALTALCDLPPPPQCTGTKRKDNG